MEGLPKFDNEKRNRYYGLRRGDIVSYPVSSVVGAEKEEGEVKDYGALDNNAVYVKFEDKDEPVKCVAEWCRMVTKVEDRDTTKFENQHLDPEFMKAKAPGEVKCGKCGTSGVKIYRPYGSFYRLVDNRCNKCLSKEDGSYIPNCPDEDGHIWGYSSIPQDVCDAFFALPEEDSNSPSFVRLKSGKTLWNNRDDYDKWVERAEGGVS